ncbi:uncharacterized protein LOC103508616 isoform X2 [Diaphorina citri]|uniref:Uncharacterized protein LOC103508616 isoform X2 n=1 Tax=Diaphorina citri TaxID=121845 RepID=A0A1S3D0A1_DIACI|nr:uncharacterized protein LOC103508616 isoform X2 [Diaphorina citri]
MAHLQIQSQPMLNMNRLHIYKVIFIPASFQDTIYRDLGNPISKQGCRPFTDFLVPMVAVPLLVMFGLMLQSLMQNDWTQDSATRWQVMGLAVALLFVSLMVCCYITSRLGLCVCTYTEDTAEQFIVSMIGVKWIRYISMSSDEVFRTSRCLPLHRVGIAQDKPHTCEMPPSYESATVELPPPPYSSVLILDPGRLTSAIRHI